MALYPSSGSPAHSLFGNGDGLQSASPQLVAYLICNVIRADGKPEKTWCARVVLWMRSLAF
jgi:hypothetical protein